MRKRLAFSLALISILLVMSATIGSNPVKGADYTKVGVSLGATADYSLSSTWTTANRLHIYVYGIVGSVVTLNVTEYYPNGTSGPTVQEVGDLVIGGLFSRYLISGNLAPGDPIYSGASYVISDAPVRQVAGASRPQNHIVDTNYFGLGLRIDWYWDQASGLATEITSFWVIGWYNFTLTSTSLWSGLPLTTILLAGGAVVAIIAAVVLIRRRK